MDAAIPSLRIESRFGLLRNLVPMYGGVQMLWIGGMLCIAVLAFLLLGQPLDRMAWVFVPVLLISQFQDRPRRMFVSAAQAQALADALARERHYILSPTDQRWHPSKPRWWSRWPHQYIEISSVDGRPCVFADLITAKRLKAFLEYHHVP